jgi:hypothetical protein
MKLSWVLFGRYYNRLISHHKHFKMTIRMDDVMNLSVSVC